MDFFPAIRTWLVEASAGIDVAPLAARREAVRSGTRSVIGDWVPKLLLAFTSTLCVFVW